MAVKPETKLQQKIRAALIAYAKAEEEHLYIFKMHGGPYSVAGVPDLDGCFMGRYFGIEVKMPGREKTLTPKQAHHLKQIKLAGGFSAVVSNKEDAIAVFKKIQRAERRFR